jgi:ferredoxin
VEAIYSEDEVPQGQEHFLEINERLAQQWPVITAQKEPPADADEWADVQQKEHHLEE